MNKRYKILVVPLIAISAVFGFIETTKERKAITAAEKCMVEHSKVMPVKEYEIKTQDAKVSKIKIILPVGTVPSQESGSKTADLLKDYLEEKHSKEVPPCSKEYDFHYLMEIETRNFHQVTCWHSLEDKSPNCNHEHYWNLP